MNPLFGLGCVLDPPPRQGPSLLRRAAACALVLAASVLGPASGGEPGAPPPPPPKEKPAPEEEKGPADAEIEGWVKDLADESFERREAAEKKLRGAGPRALPILEKARSEGDPEAARRAGEIREDLLRERVAANFEKLLAEGGENPDLEAGVVAIAGAADPGADPGPVRKTLEEWAEAVKKKFPEKAEPRERASALCAFLFEEKGFHVPAEGPETSDEVFLPAVLAGKKGDPLILPVLFTILARRVGLEARIVGPSDRPLVAYRQGEREAFVDAAAGGRSLRREDVRLLFEQSGKTLKPEDLDPAPHRAVLRSLLDVLCIVEEDEKTKRILERMREAAARPAASEKEKPEGESSTPPSKK